MSERMKALVRGAMKAVSKDMKTLHCWVAREKGEADVPDPRCCLNLSPNECANVPGRICTGMNFDEPE